MISDVKINLDNLKSEKNNVIYIYKKQLDAFRYIKQQIERVQWYDDQYDRLIESLNIIGRTLSNALHTLTNGNEVYAIDDLTAYAERYLDNERKFPHI